MSTTATNTDKRQDAAAAPEGTPLSPEPSMVRRTFLAATAGGLATLGAGLAATNALVLPQTVENYNDGVDADQWRLFDYVYGNTKSESWEFTATNMSRTGRLCFGSSEFHYSAPLIPQCPQAVFGEHNTGVDLTYVGEAYDQSLWNAIAAGAYAQADIPNRDVALFVSPQWFFRGNGAQKKFKSKFSYELYRAFCDNTQVSEQTRSYVHDRLLALGIDKATLADCEQATPIDELNDLVIHAQKDAKLRLGINDLVSQAPLLSEERRSGTWSGEPDWDALLAQADETGWQMSASNDMGIYNDYWKAHSKQVGEYKQSFDDAELEFADFQALLDVCREAGLSPIVVLIPMHGAWYDDRAYIDVDERQGWYDRMIDICDQNGLPYADFQSCEYERYFFCDTVHPGWRGWVRIEKALYHHFLGQDDEFLGGKGHGQVTGQGLVTMGDQAKQQEQQTAAEGSDRQ